MKMANVSLNCGYCGKLFEKTVSDYNRAIKRGQDNNRMYCSTLCSSKNYKRKSNPIPCVSLTCYCGKTFNRIKSQYEWYSNKYNFFYCSKDCLTEKQISNIRPFKYYLKGSRSNKKDNHSFDIDEDYLRKLWEDQNGKCQLTNIPLKLHMGYSHSGKKTLDTASLDRKDSSIGYIKGNVQFVALGCNLAKNSRSDNDLIDFLQKIVDYFPKRA